MSKKKNKKNPSGLKKAKKKSAKGRKKNSLGELLSQLG